MSRLDRPIIYFLKRADGDVKIGKTFEDLFNQRVQGIMREHGPLELLGIIDGYSAKERELHKRFEAHQALGVLQVFDVQEAQAVAEAQAEKYLSATT